MSNLLVFRFTIVNGILAVAAAALAIQGYITPVFHNDQSYLSFAIAGLFVVGWCWSAKETIIASMGLNLSDRVGPRPAAVPDADKDLGKVAWLNDITEYLVQLGLLGTVTGFVIALSGIDQGSVSSATGAQTAVAKLMEGMATALGTTLLGAALSIWHGINMRMLATALSNYWNTRLVATLQEGGTD